MALFRDPEHQIGRGEVAESRVEIPFFVAFMALASVALLFVHLYLRNGSITLATAVSSLVFGLTILRVDLGVYLLVVAMLLSPEINAGEVGRVGRNLNVRYDDVLIILVFLGVMVKRAWEGQRELWRPSPINIPICMYYGVCVVSMLLAFRASVPLYDKKTATFVMLKMAEFFMVFFLVGSALRDLQQVRRQLVLFFVVAAVVSAYAVHSRFGSLERVGAPFEQGGGEPNTLGGYLVAVMCLAGGIFVCAPSRGKRWGAFAMVMAAFFPFVFTLSRASYLAFLVGILVLAVVGRSKWAVAFLIAVLVAYQMFAPTDVKDRVNYTFQRGSGGEVVIGNWNTGLSLDKSTQERIGVWQKVRYNLHVWPWFGGGPAWHNVLDSQYARVIIETGLLGIAAFVFMQYRILKTVQEAYRWSGDWFGRGVALGTFAATVALIVHSLGTISFLIVRIMEPYWFLVALSVVVRGVAVEEYMRGRPETAARAEVG